MPEMDFLLNCDDAQTAALLVSAVMFFPSEVDQQSRQHWVSKNILAVAGRAWERDYSKANTDDERLALARQLGQDLGESLYGIVGGWVALCDAVIGQKQHLPPGKQAGRRLGQGVQAGLILSNVLKNKKFGINTACEQVEKDWNSTGGTLIKDVRLPKDSEGLRKRVWPTMRPSAHLWLAYMTPALNGARSWAKPTGFTFLPLYDFPGGVLAFLAKAEDLLKQGETRMPATGPRIPFLREAESWRVPKGLKLHQLSKETN
jgi:hypothetical protein